MARTALTVQTISTTAITPTYAAADTAAAPDGNYFTWPGGVVILQAKNTNAASRTVTIDAPQTVDGISMTDVVLTVDATTGDELYLIGPRLVQTNGQVYINTSGSNVTLAVFQVTS